jgi:hypothetical protein
MSLQVFAIPSGECHIPDPIPTSIEDLKQQLAKLTSINPDHQLILTSKGRPVRLQTFLAEVRCKRGDLKSSRVVSISRSIVLTCVL